MRATLLGSCLLVLAAGSLHGGPAVDPLAPPTYNELHGHPFVAHRPHRVATTTAALKARVHKLESMLAERPPPPPHAFLRFFIPAPPPPLWSHVSPHGWKHPSPQSAPIEWRDMEQVRWGAQPWTHHGWHRGFHRGWHHGWHHGPHHHRHPLVGLIAILLMAFAVRKLVRCCCAKRRRRNCPQTAQQLHDDERLAFEMQQMESQHAAAAGVTTYAPCAPEPVPVVASPVTPGVAVPMSNDFHGVPQGFVVGTPVTTMAQ